MMGRLYFILALVFFLSVGYWFVAHSFVIVRLTSVLGFLGLWALFALLIFAIKRLL